MDPISTTASAIAIIQATIAIGKGIQLVWSLRHVPAEFDDLLRELGFLQLAWQYAQGTLRNTSTTELGDTSLEPLMGELKEVCTGLEELSARLQSKPSLSAKSRSKLSLSRGEAGSTELVVSKWRWQQEKENLASLRKRAEVAKSNLTLCMMSFNALIMDRHTNMLLRQEAISFDTREMVLEIRRGSPKLLTGNEASATEKASHFDAIENTGFSNGPDGVYEGDNSEDSIDLSLTPPREVSDTLTTQKYYDQVQARPPRFEVIKRQSCHRACGCRCHDTSTLVTPNWLRPLVGDLSMRCSTSALPGSWGCNVSECRSTSASHLDLFYLFPPWIMRRAAVVAASWGSLGGPGASLHLKVPKLLPWMCRLWEYIENGNLDALQRSLENGVWAAIDIDEDGETLVMYCINQGQYGAAQMVLDYGSNPNAKSRHGVSAIVQARYDLKHYQQKDSDRKILEDIISLDVSGENELAATAIEEAMWEQCTESLVRALAATPQAVNRPNKYGLSPLSQAIEADDIDAVRTLLDNGADPNVIFVGGFTPLSYACHLANGPNRDKDLTSKIVESLLAAGADLNPAGIDPPIACLGLGNPGLLELLLSRGALVKYEYAGVRQNVLHRFASCHLRSEYNQTLAQASLAALLKAGLFIEERDSQGLTPLARAIQYSNVAMTQTMINAGAHRDCEEKYGRGILHFAAWYFDAGVVEVLHRAEISSIDPDARDKWGRTPYDIVYGIHTGRFDPIGPRRPDADDVRRFEDLLDGIEAHNDELMRLGGYKLPWCRDMEELESEAGEDESEEGGDVDEEGCVEEEEGDAEEEGGEGEGESKALDDDVDSQGDFVDHDDGHSADDVGDSGRNNEEKVAGSDYDNDDDDDAFFDASQDPLPDTEIGVRGHESSPRQVGREA